MILAIETSCDETAAAVVEKIDDSVRVRSSVVSSQIALHAPFGGVVPNLAAREHAKNVVPVVESALRSAGISLSDIEAIAVTVGPGLAPALQIGVAAAKSLSYIERKPLIPIHHIEGHIYANFIERRRPNSETRVQTPEPSTSPFPLLALVVSGGHTELVLMHGHFSYEILGATEDDAVGEAFDKVAKMLGLPYPGGPEIAKRAREFQDNLNDALSQETIPEFPRPMKESGDYRFSFSGLKTAVLYFLKKNESKKIDKNFINAVCYEFQEAALDVLLAKTRRALEEYRPKTIVLAGGVSANTELRRRMGEMVALDFPNTIFLMPPFEYSLDNAAMIGAAALFRWDCMSPEAKAQSLTEWQTLNADPNMPFNSNRLQSGRSLEDLAA